MNIKLKAALITLAIFILVPSLIWGILHYPGPVFAVILGVATVMAAIGTYGNVLDELEEKQNKKSKRL